MLTSQDHVVIDTRLQYRKPLKGKKMADHGPTAPFSAKRTRSSCFLLVSNHDTLKHLHPQIKKVRGRTNSTNGPSRPPSADASQNTIFSPPIECNNYLTTQIEGRYYRSCSPPSTRFEPFPTVVVNTHRVLRRQDFFWLEMFRFCRKTYRLLVTDRCHRRQWWKRKQRKKVALR